MNFKRIAAALLSAALLVSGCGVYATDTKNIDDKQNYSEEYKAFEQIAKYVSERYIDDSLTQDDIMSKGLSALLEGDNILLVDLLKATLESMDDYSEFYTAEEYKQFQDKLNPTFYGKGITMRNSEDGYVEITGFAAGNDKAQKAGFEIGDKIYKVNGEDVTGLGTSEVRNKIVGEKNTTVDITVLREGKEIELTATRTPVYERSVYNAVLEDNVGYIQISSFASNTYAEFNETLNIMRENGVKSIILDLRNNPGGLVSPAVEIAQQIVPKGKIIDVKYRESEYDITYNSKLEKAEFNFAVLVNQNTASASEILSSAIQDSGCGKLVGMQTYGKAVIQNTFPLANGMVFKLTIGQYITRNGNEINHKGLTPDEKVENNISKIDMSKYTPFDFKTRVSLGGYGDNVKSAKEKLKVLGFYDADTDGNVFDESLMESVKNFQSANDIFAYGVLDVPTQVRIDEVFADIDYMEDKQLDAAYKLLTGKERTKISE